MLAWLMTSFRLSVSVKASFRYVAYALWKASIRSFMCTTAILTSFSSSFAKHSRKWASLMTK